MSPNQSPIIDAFSDPGDCGPIVNLTEDEMNKQMEYFSRKLDPELFNNALWIWGNLTDKDPNFKGKLLVHTWELYDKAFKFDRVRRYQFVQENMDMLQHFEDNLNLNIANSVHFQNFLRVATTVRKNLNDKFGGDGGFIDPATIDPYDIEEPEFKDFSVATE